VLVGLKSTADKEKLGAAGQAARHACRRRFAAGADPGASRQGAVEREYNVQKDIALQSGKPEAVVEKMMEGRMRKYYEERCCCSRSIVIDGETQIAKLIEKASKDLGAPVEIEGFVRFQVGEGIEKAEADFADEVAQMAGGR
jgi:elongation factor Ts